MWKKITEWVIKNKGTTAVIVVLVPIVASVVIGFYDYRKRYFASQETIAAYENQVEELEQRIVQLTERRIESKTEFFYDKEGKIEKKVVTEGIDEKSKTDTKTNRNTEVVFPYKHKLFLAGLEYDFGWEEYYVKAGICLHDTVNVEVGYPINLKVKKFRLRVGLSVRF